MALPTVTFDMTERLVNDALAVLDPAVQTEGIYSDSQRIKVINRFASEASVANLGTDAEKTQAFLTYLAGLADGGGSKWIDNDGNMIIRTNNAGTLGREILSKFNEIITHMEDLDFYTHHRTLATFANMVRKVLKRRDEMTPWGVKHHMPERYKEYAFPGAENCKNIPADALAALACARNFALNRAVRPSATTHFAEGQPPNSLL